MKPQLVFAALAVMVVSCSSGGGGGTASIPFDPFGIEPTPGSGAEPSGGQEIQPGTSASLQQLCETYCVRLASACYGNGACGASDCADITKNYPACRLELQTFFACAAKAPIQCGYSGSEVLGCDAAVQAIQQCIGYGTDNGSARGI
jgi:hypothetical protein